LIKYIRPQNCAFSDIFGSDLTRRVCMPCMGIAVCHRRKFGQVSSPTKSRRKTPWPKGIPLDLRLPHGKIVIILRCNPWAGGWSPEGTFWGFSMGKIGQNPKIGQPHVVQKKLTDLGNGPWTTTWSKQYLSAVHSVTCSE